MDTQLAWMVMYGALVVESLVNIVKNVKATRDPRVTTPWQYWASLFLGLTAGVLVAWNYNIDLFTLVGMEGNIPWLGSVITGLIMSRGSNVLSDLIGRLNSWKK